MIAEFAAKDIDAADVQRVVVPNANPHLDRQ